MAVVDYFSELTAHKSGLSVFERKALGQFWQHTPRHQVDYYKRVYEGLCKTIDKMLEGKIVHDGLTEAEMADMVGHIILDAALVHAALVSAGAWLAPFPYDQYADKLLPKKKKEVLQ